MCVCVYEYVWNMERCKERNLKLNELLRVNEASKNNTLDRYYFCSCSL